MKRRLIASVTAVLLLVPASGSVAVGAGASGPADSAVPPAAQVVARAAGAQTDYSQVIDKLRQEIPGLMAAGQSVGLSIALVDGDRTVWAEGFGWADRERKRPVTPDTLFHIGSSSKTLTAAAVMQLVEQGKVDLDAPLRRYVPEFSMQPRFSRNVVTLRSVMTHHSGIPEDIPNGMFTMRRPYRAYLDSMIRAVRKIQPERRVGAAWAYSNTAIALLQRVVENVSGQGFLAYTRKHLFRPMGMKSTTFDDAAAPRRRLARGYQTVIDDDGSQRVVSCPREYANIWAAGSVVSSATEMARYLKTMIARGTAPGGKQILRRKTVRKMITKQPSSPWDVTYFRMGLVWWLIDSPDGIGKRVEHGGDTQLHHTALAWLPGTDLGVFVSVNTAGTADVRGPVSDLALHLMHAAKTGQPATPASAPAGPGTASQAELDAIVGRYAASGIGVIDVSASDGNLLVTTGAQVPGAAAVTFRPTADGWFLSDTAGGGSIKSATIKGNKVLLARGGWKTGLFALRIPPHKVSKAWRDRVGDYKPTRMLPNNYPSAPGAPVNATVSLSMWEGLLILDDSVLMPAGQNRAFTYGGQAMQVMRGDGTEVRASGRGLHMTGLRYVPRKR